MTTQQVPLKIPALLLEGDGSSPSPGIKAGQNPNAELRPGALPVRTDPPQPRPSLAAAPAASAEQPKSESADLPETYGTGKLLLVARDPHCLYTHWDISPEEQRQHNQLAASQHLVVRVHADTAAAAPASEIDVHPESRHWFVPVEKAATTYVAELGYYQPDGQWKSISTSTPAATPPDAISEDKTLQFASIPSRASAPAEGPSPELGFGFVAVTRVLAPILPPRVGWIPALEATPVGFPDFPMAPTQIPESSLSMPAPQWTAEAESVFAEFARLIARRQRSFDSMALVELDYSLPDAENPSSLNAPAGISSPLGGGQGELPGFCLRLNAELVVYGATEPDANVTIAGRPIQLRPDGTFSYRFALPDGNYQLPVTATSARGDWRQAELNFSRQTEYRDPTSPASDVRAANQAPPLLHEP